MTTPVSLGLDLGGANLKLAHSHGSAVTVPFALWRERARLPVVLQEQLARYPGDDPLAITMTGELCDCYATSAEGVRDLLAAVRQAAPSRPAHVWTIEGRFASLEEVDAKPLLAAAANWLALATWVRRRFPEPQILLIDIGSTTTDFVRLGPEGPISPARTDTERLASGELIYQGVVRTPAMSLLPPGRYPAELFATIQDAYVLQGDQPEQPHATDTADGRPATREHAHGRLARMLGGDREQTSRDATLALAQQLTARQKNLLEHGLRQLLETWPGQPDCTRMRWVVSGTGEFLAKQLVAAVAPVPAAGDHSVFINRADSWPYLFSLSHHLGPIRSACAPAVAVAELLRESWG